MRAGILLQYHPQKQREECMHKIFRTKCPRDSSLTAFLLTNSHVYLYPSSSSSHSSQLSLSKKKWQNPFFSWAEICSFSNIMTVTKLSDIYLNSCGSCGEGDWSAFSFISIPGSWYIIVQKSVRIISAAGLESAGEKVETGYLAGCLPSMLISL